MVQESKTSLRFKNSTYQELQLIAAEVNAKGIGTFLDDFLIAWVMAIKVGDPIETPTPVIFSESEESALRTHRIKTTTLYELRIVAVKAGFSLKHYIESIGEWLANEHRENGRYWFDDTPKRALPIRTRAL